MKAAVHERYGPAEVVRIREVARPVPKANEVLVEVHASSVTTADWRLRASAFPGGMWLLGRLVAGLFSPRNRVLGTEFAGRVIETGGSAHRFTPGTRVFGVHSGFGAHAEYLAISQDASIARTPGSTDYREAAAVPFGALCALVFLRDFARVTQGQRVLVAGASGGVGVFGVQIAKKLGAEVTAVCSADNHALVRSLGADHVVDYREQDFTAGDAQYDVVFDTAGTTRFGQVRRVLTEKGMFLPLEFGLGDVLQALISGLTGGRKMLLRVSGDKREDLETIARWMEKGDIRPVVDRVCALEDIVAAYRRVESRHKTGSVVIEVRASRH